MGTRVKLRLAGTPVGDLLPDRLPKRAIFLRTIPTEKATYQFHTTSDTVRGSGSSRIGIPERFVHAGSSTCSGFGPFSVADPDPKSEPFVRDMDPDPSIIKQK